MSAAETTTVKVPPARRDPSPGSRCGHPGEAGQEADCRRGGRCPGLLLAPCLLILLLVLGYPLVRLVTLSFQKFGQAQLWGFQDAESVGFDNFTKILGDSEFWTVVAAHRRLRRRRGHPDHGARHADRPAAPARLRLGEDR